MVRFGHLYFFAFYLVAFVIQDSAAYAQEKNVKDSSDVDAAAEKMLEPDVENHSAPNADPSGLPKIISHSASYSSIYKGDRLRLSVRAQGTGMFYRWVRGEETVCTKATCNFETDDWGLGVQVVTMVVYNRYGSQKTSFTVKVLARPAEHDPTLVERPLVKAEHTQSLAAADFYAKALRGIGYAYSARDVGVLAQVERAILWNERIRAHALGVAQFGVAHVEEHYVFPSAEVKLIYVGDGLPRAIDLLSGQIRTRQLRDSLPDWVVRVDNWLQVDGNSKADFLIERFGPSNNSVRITSMRGAARVTLLTPSQNGVARNIFVPVGTALEVSENGQAQQLLPDTKVLAKAVARSSPQYMRTFSKKPSHKTSFITSDEANPKAKSSSGSALEQARSLVDEADGFLALEKLMTVPQKNHDGYEYLVTSGDAYKVLGLYREAFAAYNKALAANSSEARPALAIGEIYFLANNCRKAKSWLQRGNSLLYGRNQRADYFLGVCYYRTGQKYTARNFFRFVVASGENEDMVISAQEFLKTINNDRWYGATLSGRMGRDGNVFRWGNSERTTGYETAASMYYEGIMDAFYRAYENFHGSLLFGYYGDKVTYLETSLKDVSPLVQRLYLTWNMDFGATRDQEASVRVKIQPELKLVTFGNERSGDYYLTETQLGSPRMMAKPALVFRVGMLSDPLPAKNDLLDPELREPVGISDRSASLKGYGLLLDFTDFSGAGMKFKYLINTLKHKDSLVNVDDYSEKIAQVDADAHVSTSVPLQVSMGYLLRGFVNADDGRSDKALFIKGKIGYLFTPAFSTDLSADYFNQKSSRDSSGYVRSDYSLGLNLEI